jgi:hypothetical protein
LHREAGEALFSGTQMQLGEQFGIFESGGDDAFAEVGDGFGDDADALLVFGAEKKWAKERAVDAIAEGEFFDAEPVEKFCGQVRGLLQKRLKEVVPGLGGIGGHGGAGGGHFDFPDGGTGPVALAGLADGEG